MIDEAAKEKLAKKLDPNVVKKRDQAGTSLSYVEGHYVIRTANDIFGFDGWSRALQRLEKVSEETNQKGNHVVGYLACVEVWVRDSGGERHVSRVGTGFGVGIARSLADAHESAVKEAETDAMKRALMTFGDQFGLALYDKEKKNVATEAETKLAQPLATGDQQSACAEAIIAADGEDAYGDTLAELILRFNEKYGAQALKIADVPGETVAAWTAHFRAKAQRKAKAPRKGAA